MNKLAARIFVTLVAAVGSTAALSDNIARPPATVADDIRTQQDVQPAKVELQKNPVINGWRYVGGEVAWELQPVSGSRGKTRAQILDELTAHQNDPQQQQRHDHLYQGGA